MRSLDEEYPGYNFARHKGYGTALHAEAILREGVTPIHRKSFAPIKAALGLVDGGLMEEDERRRTKDEGMADDEAGLAGSE